MVVKLECPRTGKVATLPSATWEQVEGGEILCPVCGEHHAAILAPDGVEPLYPVGAITLATFLGSTLAGGIVIALNYRRLGRTPAAVRAVILGLLGAGVTLVLAFALPEKTPGVLCWLPPLLLVNYLAKKAFTTPIEERAAAGIQPAGFKVPALVGGACLLLILGGLAAWIFLDSPFPGARIGIGSDDVYHSAGATEGDARKLHEVLTEVGFLDGSRRTTVHLEKTDRGYALDLVLVEDAWNDAEVIVGVLASGNRVADAGFGRPLKIRLCDETPEVRRTLTIE